MDKSTTWWPLNDLDSWYDYSFNQTAKWQCAQLERVDTIPCQGDYVLVGRESFGEAIQTDCEIKEFEAGSLEFMKYKLWAELPGSPYSACHYGRLALEKPKPFKTLECSLSNPVSFSMFSFCF